MKYIFEDPCLAFKHEDGHSARIGTIDNTGDEGAEEKCLFVRIQSWDESGQHPEATQLKGKPVRVTVEEIKQPIYEPKPGYELGMGDFLIQQVQALQACLEQDDESHIPTGVYEVLQALKKRIGTTPYTPDGCRIPYYPI